MSQGIFEKPHVTPQLVEHLEAVFRDRLPDNLLTITDRELGQLFGQQKVVEYIRGLLVQQEGEPIL